MSDGVCKPRTASAAKGDGPRYAAAKRKRTSAKAKESLRKRMRRLLGKSLELLTRDIDAALDGDSDITQKDLLEAPTLLARFGVGTEDHSEVERQTTQRYVIRVPARRSNVQVPAMPIAVAEAPNVRQITAEDQKSHRTLGE